MGQKPDPTPGDNPSLLRDSRSLLEARLVSFIAQHTPKCHEMTQILSRAMDQPVPFGLRLRVWSHFLICCWCHRYGEQLKLIRRYCRRLPEADAEGPSLPVERKERIRKNLESR